MKPTIKNVIDALIEGLKESDPDAYIADNHDEKHTIDGCFDLRPVAEKLLRSLGHDEAGVT